MQIILKGGSTGTHPVTTTPIAYPITPPVLALGTTEVGALVEVPAGLSANLQAQLVYRFWGTDDSQSAGTWATVDTAQQGPGKAFKKGTVSSVTGLLIQLGLELSMTTGSTTGRGLLKAPVVVTT